MNRYKTRENVEPLSNVAGGLVKQDMEKAEISDAFFALVLTSKTILQES